MQARILSADLCHRNGLGSSLTASIYSMIACSSSTVERRAVNPALDLLLRQIGEEPLHLIEP